MRLIGMPDSPYLRRVAVSMHCMGLPFVHEPLSVFRDYEAFAAINPVVKAPTLVTDDGVVLMESTLILAWLGALAGPGRILEPLDLAGQARAQRIIGLALAACDKTVQLVYEFNLRPAEKQHQPWVDRVRGQLALAYALLEAELGPGKAWLFGERPLQADISAAVAWRFSQHVDVGAPGATDCPALAALSARAEALPEFLAAPIA